MRMVLSIFDNTIQDSALVYRQVPERKRRVEDRNEMGSRGSSEVSESDILLELMPSKFLDAINISRRHH